MKEIVMNEAKSLEEAKTWFAANTTGELRCVKEDGAEKTCASFDEAQEFYGAAEPAEAKAE